MASVGQFGSRQIAAPAEKWRHILLNQQPEHVHAILDLLRSRGRITMGELEKLTTYSRHNLKKSLEKLVKTGQVRQNGMGKGTWYTLA